MADDVADRDDADRDDAELAAHLADQAGALLLQVRATSGLEGRALAKEGDRVAEEFLAAELAAARPDDLVLSEEGVDDATRLIASRVWIVDPLDGTREYSEGRHDWAVHVALWAEDVLVAGAVALPARGLVLGTDHPPTVPDRDPDAPLRVAVSRTRPPTQVQRLVEQLQAETVPMGSAGYKVSAVLLGEADAYVHAGGQYEWDSAAPVAVARAAGLHTSRIDGSPMHYNQVDPLLPDLVVCRPDDAAAILEALRDQA
jgi:3'(2'), 5'-bisphosphate nucleotidase